ncbi:MAG TPA: baseplate J/gp47 family protein [Methanocella sp.]|nr:baseplate J/gp47 family protein [Methanocella sp.]
MTFVRKSYGEITDSILAQITKGVVSEKYEHAPSRTKYKLGYPNVKDIVSVKGTLKGAPFTFRKGTDYRLSDGMLEWLREGEKPDRYTPFFAYYLVDVPRGITDVNPGSVTRTLVESVALEMDFLYAQMNQVYNAGFIDTATGKALDLVVSMLGVTRKAAGYAMGEVTFGRNNPPGSLEVSSETYVFDGKDRYELKNPMVKEIKKVECDIDGKRTAFTEGTDYALESDKLAWLPGGKRPSPGSVFTIDYAVYEKIAIPINTTVSTYSRNPENIKTFRTTKEAVLACKPDGKWETEVPVMAMAAGKEGNLFAGSINVMPKPVPGIEYVINKRDIMNGTEVESDAELRGRAKRALEMAGKATLRSLKAAVQGVEGVTGEVVVIDQPDNIPGIIQIIASGGDDAEIKKAIEDTRSAGILVEFKRPSIVPLDIKLTLFVVEGVDKAEARAKVDGTVREYLGTLNIGDGVVISQVVKAALNIPGVRDVRDVTVNDSKENIDIRQDERGEFKTLEIYVEE